VGFDFAQPTTMPVSTIHAKVAKLTTWKVHPIEE